MSPKKPHPAAPTQRAVPRESAPATEIAPRKGAPPTIAAGNAQPGSEDTNRQPWEDFENLEEVGRGGMGIVYKAHQRSLDRIVALKVLAPALAADAEAIERFIQGARASARLHHENVVTGFAVGEDCGRYYFAMEYVEGENLEDILAREGRLTADDVIRIALALARALQHAESRNLVHRDIKPGNILITRDGAVKLTDLGIAKTLDRPGITQHDSVFGTPWYMSPEQSRSSREVDIRADIYSLGATLYHLLTGHPPFEADNLVDVLVAMDQGRREPIDQQAIGCPPELIALVDRMMERDPSRRFQSPSDLLRVLESLPHRSQRFSWLDSKQPAIEPVARDQRHDRWLRLDTRHAVGLSLAAAAAFGAFFYVSSEGPHAPAPAPAAPTAIATEVAPTPVPTVRSEASFMAEVVDAVTSATPRLSAAKYLLDDLRPYYPENTDFARMGAEMERGTLILFEAKVMGTKARVPAWGDFKQTMTSGDEYRFAVLPTATCHLYIFQVDAAARPFQIFPSPLFAKDLENPLEAGRLHWLPSGDKGIGLDTETGVERVFMVSLSRPMEDPKSFLEQLSADPAVARTGLDNPESGPIHSCFAKEWMYEFRFEHR